MKCIHEPVKYATVIHDIYNENFEPYDIFICSKCKKEIPN